MPQHILTGSYKKKTFEGDSFDFHSRVEKTEFRVNRHSLHLFKNRDIHVSVIFVILQIADSQDISFVTILISKEIQHLGQRLKSVSSSNASSTTSAFRAFLSDIQLKSLGFCLNALKGCELLENVSL